MVYALLKTCVWVFFNVACAEVFPLLFVYLYGGNAAVLKYAGHSTLLVVAFAIYFAMFADFITSLPERIRKTKEAGKPIPKPTVVGTIVFNASMGLMIGGVGFYGLAQDYLPNLIAPSPVNNADFMFQVVIVSFCFISCIAQKLIEWTEIA